ncbi:MAG TPA: AmmeMemoRadiSam system radical SAM enzyme, partial [Phycisphaerae bacterium]|nr:AmmeMemoRadiSam system radical SAM enzyme [Phycisphaerae bacterium]
QMTYGLCSALAVDPVEKKPLYHFKPGSSVMSMGTVGCNLGCLFCQNCDISRARVGDIRMTPISPQDIVDAAVSHKCSSVAVTYNEPIVFAEFAMDIADAAHAANLSAVAVSNGYITPLARNEFFTHFDAINVDIKAFTDTFYMELCDAHLTPILDNIEYLVHKTDALVELTTLLIPGANDSQDEVRSCAKWIYRQCGPFTPWHLTAFRPCYKLIDRPPTSLETLTRSREIALEEGLKFVYTGNAVDLQGSTTFCPSCGKPVIRRDIFQVTMQAGSGMICKFCGCDLSEYFIL